LLSELSFRIQFYEEKKKADEKYLFFGVFSCIVEDFCRKKQVEKWKKEITWSQDKNFPFSSVADPDP
jgi:hypothetical protein